MPKTDKNTYNHRLDYIQKYSKENYDRINLTVKKGLKEYFKEYAAQIGENLSSFFVIAANEYIERHKNNKDNSPE